MPDLLLRKRLVPTVFSLLGDKENHISYSIAWGLSQSPHFLKLFIRNLTNKAIDVDRITINLQEQESNSGITDIEIKLEGQIHLIIEAKKGWNIPRLKQLQRYADRLSFRESKAPIRYIVTMSECSTGYAKRNLAANNINGVPIVHVSWEQLTKWAYSARHSGSHREKRLLSELILYLEALMTMQKYDSNLVYVVSLSSKVLPRWKISFIDIVKKRSMYFHPAEKGWPPVPPNYIAFRYHGKLQSIHHIKNYQMVEFLHPHFREIPLNASRRRKRFLYALGKGFAPDHDVPTGNLYANGRVWCMLDTLFTSRTIWDARNATKRRQKAIQ